MPNHVTNRLTIIGDVEELLKIAAGPDANGKTGHAISFNTFIPMPPDILRGDVGVRETRPNWYRWSIDNWGTKWDAYDVNIQPTDNGAVITLDTAWSPPIPVINKIAELFPHLSIVHEFVDEGWNFAGETRYEKGQPVYQKEGDHDADREYIREMLMELTGWEEDEEE